MKFTTEEIALCKKIVEKHRREIGIGDWFAGADKEINLCTSELLLNLISKYPDKTTPLWQISDCLEFLEEKGLGDIFNFKRFKNGNWSFTAEDERYTKTLKEGKTRLIACLKAVLVIVEES